jgi:hypothetical protein
VVDFTSLGSLDNESSHGSPLVADKVVVDHTGGKGSRNSDTVGRGVSVGQNNNTVSSLNSSGGLVADLIEVADVALDTLRLGEGQVNGLDSPLGMDGRHVLDGIELRDREDWARQEETATLGSIHLQEVALGTNVALQGHDNGLSDGIDRRVRDLGKQLAEVVIEETGSRGKARKRSIVTHGAQGFLFISGHRRQQQTDLLMGITEGEKQRILLETGVVGLGLKVERSLESLEDLGHGDELTVQPGTEIVSAGNRLLQLLVVNDTTGLGVDQEHTTGLQTSLLNDRLGLDRNCADLGGTDDTIIVHHVETARSQTVSVQVGTTVTTISESEQRRTVPRFHLASGPLVERGLLGIHVVVALPGLGNHQHNGFREGKNAVDSEKFEDVVKSSGVRASILNDRVHRLQLLLEDVRVHHTLTSAHPVLVSTQGVDLSVVGSPS